jgi:uncharacterized protein
MVLPVVNLLDAISPERLHLILLPTEACNFRCVYCYESFQLKRMDPSVVTGVKRLLERRAPNLGHLTISWFGGEPLLARDVMEDVLGHVGRLREAHRGLEFASDVTTNAYLLTRPLMERLVRAGATDYQISFDGPRAWHDRKRVRPGGLPTFDRVWGNLRECRRSDAPVRIFVRLHVDSENAAAIPEFLEEYRAEFASDDRFQLYIRGLSRLGGPNDPSLPILEGEARAETIDALRRRAAEMGIRQPQLRPESFVCYAAMGNSFVIRADGRVNKCTVALDHPRNQVGRLDSEGKFHLQNELVRPWMRGFDSENRAELSCPMRGLADVGSASALSTDARSSTTGTNAPIVPGTTIALMPARAAGGAR